MKNNKKGMTLIEILVVLLISTMLMMIAGGIIISSMGYFEKTADTDFDKQITDSISSLVQNELMYATDVQVAKTKPSDEEWHWLSLNEKGYLMKDDTLLYPENFYNRKSLQINVNCYSNKYRMDLKFILKDGTMVPYQTALTIEFINIKNELVANEIENVDENSNYKSVVVDAENGNKIYYQKGKFAVVDDPEIPPAPDLSDLTVGGEERRCTGDGENGFGKPVEWEYGAVVKRGGYVSYNGKIYRYMNSGPLTYDNKHFPDVEINSDWKLIDDNWNQYSIYAKGDIVYYNNKWYQFKWPEYGSNYIPETNTTYNWTGGYDTLEELIEDPAYVAPSCKIYT